MAPLGCPGPRRDSPFPHAPYPFLMPEGFSGLGRSLLALGLVIAAVGLLLLLAERFPGLRLGRLPGDIRVERGDLRFYFPLATSLLLSAALTLLLWLLRRR